MASISRTIRPLARVAATSRSSLRPVFVRATPQYVDSPFSSSDSSICTCEER